VNNSIKDNEETMEETIIVFKMFSIRTSKPADFIEQLDALCQKYSINADYFFSYMNEG
jgi:predicted DNA-binding protein with PD1-like motif